ncbi:hypothetical protein P9112_004348 [Eukaryota sp. TZLM1-RC]
MSSDLEHPRKFYILYPLYFDSTVSRNDGRRFTKDLCVDKPTMDELGQCLKSLSIEYKTELHKRHPRSWDSPGRIIIYPSEGHNSKTNIFKQVGSKLPEIRLKRTEQAAAASSKKKSKKRR